MRDNEMTELFDLIKDASWDVDQVQTLVCHNRDNSVTWNDVDDDPELAVGLKIAKAASVIGMIVMDDWGRFKDYFPEEVSELVEDAMKAIFSMDEQPEDDEE